MCLFVDWYNVLLTCVDLMVFPNAAFIAQMNEMRSLKVINNTNNAMKKCHLIPREICFPLIHQTKMRIKTFISFNTKTISLRNFSTRHIPNFCENLRWRNTLKENDSRKDHDSGSSIYFASSFIMPLKTMHYILWENLLFSIMDYQQKTLFRS